MLLHVDVSMLRSYQGERGLDIELSLINTERDWIYTPFNVDERRGQVSGRQLAL